MQEKPHTIIKIPKIIINTVIFTSIGNYLLGLLLALTISSQAVVIHITEAMIQNPELPV